MAGSGTAAPRVVLIIWVKLPRRYCRPVPRNDVEYQIPGDESVSMAIVRAVAAMEGQTPGTLRPLAEVLDPGALDTIFEPTHDGGSRPGGHLSFVYSSCRVTVDNGEYLTVEPLEDRPLPRSGREQDSSPDW